MDAATGSAEFLTFRLGGEEYAIDILQVREIRADDSITRIAGAPDYMRGVINLRGTIVPIVDLRVQLGFERPSEAPVVIILDLAGRVVGVMVDAVSDVTAIAAADIQPPPELGSARAHRYIRGIAPQQGRMLVVFDIARLVVGEAANAEAEAA